MTNRAETAPGSARWCVENCAGRCTRRSRRPSSWCSTVCSSCHRSAHSGSWPGSGCGVRITPSRCAEPWERWPRCALVRSSTGGSRWCVRDVAVRPAGEHVYRGEHHDELVVYLADPARGPHRLARFVQHALRVTSKAVRSLACGAPSGEACRKRSVWRLSPIPIVAVVLMLVTPKCRVERADVHRRLARRPGDHRHDRVVIGGSRVGERQRRAGDRGRAGSRSCWASCCCGSPRGSGAPGRTAKRNRRCRSGWVRSSFGPGKAVGAGVVLAAVNPKNLSSRSRARPTIAADWHLGRRPGHRLRVVHARSRQSASPRPSSSTS